MGKGLPSQNGSELQMAQISFRPISSSHRLSFEPD